MDQQQNFPSPAPLMELATAYWKSQIFLTAHRVGLFQKLSGSEKDVDEIASMLGTKLRPTKLLLNACVALGLLQINGQRYKNSRMAEAFLVPGMPSYMGNAFSYSDDLYETWGRLEQSLREDRPMLAPENYLGADPDKTRHFVYGMHNRALGTASALVDLVDLAGRNQLLDVGGGPGTYSCLLVSKYSQLKSKVLDLPGITVHADEIIKSMGKSVQVETYPGDYHTVEFPKNNDVVLISGVFHRESEDDCRKLIRKAAESLNQNGMLIISDVFTDEGGHSPAFATLFALNMLLTAKNGGIHSDQQVMEWMNEAEFHGVESRAFPPPMPHRVVVGYR